jgi:aminopeptidase N
MVWTAADSIRSGIEIADATMAWTLYMDARNNLTRDEARARAGLFTDIHYEVGLDLTRGDETFGVDTTIRFRCTGNGGSSFLDCLLASVDRVEVNGRPQPTSTFDGARIQLSDLGENNIVRVVGSGAYQHTGAGLSQFKDPVDARVYLHSQFEPFDAHRVFPCFDQPDLKGTFRFSVKAPAGWEVVSNSPADPPGGTTTDGAGSARLWTLQATPRLSTYVTAIVAGPYHVVRERHGAIDLGIYCRQSLAQYLDAAEIFEITRQGFDFYHRVFDYPYAFGKYDQLFVPEFSAGAMENAGCVTFAEGMIYRSRVTEAAREWRASTILHEMAHMWFGDLVTMRWWDDLWLNESFATFMAVLALTRATRFTNAWTTFANEEKASARRQDQLPTTHPIAANVIDVESTHLNFDAITYEKGASVLRQLFAWVGEDAFFQGLRRYFRQHAFANADLQEFLAAVGAGSGRDLHAWSKEWLETAGLNTLRPLVEHDGNRIVELTVEQEAEPAWPMLRSQRIGVGLFDLDEERLMRRRRVEFDVTGASSDVPEVAGELVPDLLLLNDGDLGYAKIRLDDQSMDTVTRHLATLDDSLARALCWSAAWDMVRDAGLAARQYLALVANNIQGETDIGVVQALLGQCGAAIHVYGDPATVPSALDRLVAVAERSLEKADPGSDLQLVWARTLTTAARSPQQLDVVKGILDGTVRFEGLQLDIDLRWHMVRSLAADGVIGPAEIKAELERDPTDAGRRHAAAALAARPTAQAKAEAWRLITEDETQPLATLRALMGGFQQPDQRPLLEPYADRYFETLGPFWKSRTIEVALAFARGMYPSVVIGEHVVSQTETYLRTQAPPGPVERILLEGQDQMRRAIRARRVDAGAPATPVELRI